jgi:sialic acid synthase SpsE
MLKKIQNSFLIAEIGWNFLGNLKLAERMIKSAKNNGADAVKFQIWDPKFLKAGKWDKDGRKQIYQKAYLDKDKYLKIKNICKKNKIICFASAFNMGAIKMLKDINEKIVKIPSHEAYNFDLINYALKNFKLVFFYLISSLLLTPFYYNINWWPNDMIRCILLLFLFDIAIWLSKVNKIC